MSENSLGPDPEYIALYTSPTGEVRTRIISGTQEEAIRKATEHLPKGYEKIQLARRRDLNTIVWTNEEANLVAN